VRSWFGQSVLKPFAKRGPVRLDSAALGPADSAVAQSPVQTLSSLEDLDQKLRDVDAAWAISDDAMREVFQSFKMEPPADLPSDPNSVEYANHQFHLYRTIAGRAAYRVDNERSDFPADPNRPFPYYTESPDTVGHQLMALGYIIRTMALPAGASVLDMGPGWGNTTIALARMGYKVTAIDIDPTFVHLIRARANKLGLEIDVRRGRFLDVDQLEEHYDAVLFFESFHHCSDHRELLQSLARVIGPGGRLFLAAEPIDDSFAMPWGIRLDGESLWAIRRNGWLELGFQESYFLRMLHHLGWVCTKHVTNATHLGVIFEVRRAAGRYEMSTFRLPPDEDATWAAPETDESLKHRYSAGHSVLSLQKSLNCDLVEVDAVNPSPLAIPFRAQHGRHVVDGLAGPQSDLTIRLPYDPGGDGLILEATTWRPSDLGGSLDHREIGLGVRTIELTDAQRISDGRT
jgi:2-polyprenyl-3-methyl-5-hydroxy-6-metoxy-1,4-benzoquinol methylase